MPARVTVPDDAPWWVRALARIRDTRGLSQSQMGGLMGVDRATISRWERQQTEVPNYLRPLLRELLAVTEGALPETVEALCDAALSLSRDAQDGHLSVETTERLAESLAASLEALREAEAHVQQDREVA